MIRTIRDTSTGGTDRPDGGSWNGVSGFLRGYLCGSAASEPVFNYYEKPETGHAAHQTAVRMENLLHEISPERTVEVYRLLGEMGFGREIVGVFRKKGK